MALQRAWLQRGALARLVWPLSRVYGALVALRRTLYRHDWLSAHKAGVPVIVVGNVIAGGAGKTPVVMAVVRHLQAQGLRVGAISRGYGRSTRDCREVHADSDPRTVGDEPLLIARSTGAPVFVARRRIDAARALLARHPATQLIVADDGLQHLALTRDIEICVFDDRGTGNGWLLPAGPLREPWPRRGEHGQPEEHRHRQNDGGELADPTNHAALVLHTGRQPAFAGFTAQRALADHALRSDGTRVPLTSLKGQPLVALAAIANPQAFFNMLRAQGLTPERCIALPDHYDFDSWLRPSDGTYSLICTEKDAVKLWRRAPDALAAPLLVTPEPAFFAALDARLAKLSSADGLQAA